jgi:hypothetical protein
MKGAMEGVAADKTFSMQYFSQIGMSWQSGTESLRLAMVQNFGAAVLRQFYVDLPSMICQSSESGGLGLHAYRWHHFADSKVPTSHL